MVWVGWRGCLVVMWGLECKRRELELGLCKKRRGQDSNNGGNSGNSGSESFCLGRQSLLKHDGLAVIGWCVYDMRSIDHAVGEASRVRLASVSLTGGDCLLASSGPYCTVRQSLTCSVRDGHGIPSPRGEGNREWGQMAISRLDGAASGWWMSCLCRCQASLWALEMTRNALQFTHWALFTVYMAPVDAVDGRCGMLQLLGKAG